MDTYKVVVAIALTLIAGLSTGVGGLISFIPTRDSRKFLSLALGFSAGIMIYVSFAELLSQANSTLTAEMGGRWGALTCALAFFGGILFIAVIDRLVPENRNPHELHNIGGGEDSARAGAVQGVDDRLMKTGLVTSLAIIIHNIPEGLATFASAVKDPKVGLVIAAAVAIHNIPEGIAVAVPIYYSSRSRGRAFWISLLSGLSEFAGALFGLLLFMPFLESTVLFAVIFAFVAGIMVFISFDELLPAAREYGEHHLSIYGLIAGMAVMALSLIILS